MKRILFLIHDLGQGGAEKVLINLVNHLDRSQFDISVTVLFGGGVNEQFLRSDIHFHAVFPRMIPGNSHWMKFFTPEQLHRLCIKEHYDIEIAYLEGPSVRVISGCSDPSVALFGWIHCTMHSPKDISAPFRSMEEAEHCYNRMNQMIFVSQDVRNNFLRCCACTSSCAIRYNTNESEVILEKSLEQTEDIPFPAGTFTWCGMGKLVSNKGFDRMLRVQRKLRDTGHTPRLLILGDGPDGQTLEAQCRELELTDSVVFLGYQTNPYKYLAKCDLFVCASHSEGFSTAATEALLLGIPVCTVEVSGMKEMLGDHNEYGIVTENSEDALYEGIAALLNDPALLLHYRQQAGLRGRMFTTESTVRSVEDMLNQANE